MASRIVEFFGFNPTDQSLAASDARQRRQCPFLKQTCVKMLRDGEISGACTLAPMTGGPVICCPNRLYAGDYRILNDVAAVVFGPAIPLVSSNAITPMTGECIAVFGKRWGKELRLPNRGRRGSYFVDWILAHLDKKGDLLSFVAIEVQSIDTTGNYQAERLAYLKEKSFTSTSTAGFNWENVNKRILPQIIYKGHVLRQEPLCQNGLFFICPTPVYAKIGERLGGGLRPYQMHPGSLTFMWYDIGSQAPQGQERPLVQGGCFTTTIDQVALAFTAPSNLPPARVYENAIRSTLRH